MRIVSLLMHAVVLIVSSKPNEAWTGSRTRFMVLQPPLSWSTSTKSTARRNAWRNSHTRLQEHASNNLLSVEECLTLYSSSNGPARVRFVDGSWYHKGSRNGRTDFVDGPRIPGSIYFDVNDIAASKELFPQINPTGLSHMQPPASLFAAFMDACGITNSDRIIVYGRAGCAFLPRIWFTFRQVMGHCNASLMQGSLEDWVQAGGPVDTEPLKVPIPRAVDLDLIRAPSYQVAVQQNVVVDLEQMKAIVSDTGSKETVIVDTRGSSFAYGHIPGAIHVPYSSLHVPDNPNRFQSAPVLRDVLQAAGVVNDSIKRVVVSCGSGVSSCSLYLALEECRLTTETTAVYDGSWEEWGSLDDVPKVVP